MGRKPANRSPSPCQSLAAAARQPHPCTALSLRPHRSPNIPPLGASPRTEHRRLCAPADSPCPSPARPSGGHHEDPQAFTHVLRPPPSIVNASWPMWPVRGGLHQRRRRLLFRPEFRPFPWTPPPVSPSNRFPSPYSPFSPTRSSSAATSTPSSRSTRAAAVHGSCGPSFCSWVLGKQEGIQFESFEDYMFQEQELSRYSFE